MVRTQHLVSLTPVPAPLQTYREARNLRLYKQAFSEVDRAVRPVSTDRRYVWLNLDIDIISLGPPLFDHFKTVAPSIRRLKFEREVTRDSFFNSGLEVTRASFFHFEFGEVCKFVNAEEVYVVCGDGLDNWRNWFGITEKHSWPCKMENVTFIDPFDGTVVRSIDMDEVFAQRDEELERRSEEERQLEEERRLEDEEDRHSKEERQLEEEMRT